MVVDGGVPRVKVVMNSCRERLEFVLRAQSCLNSGVAVVLFVWVLCLAELLKVWKADVSV